MTEAPLSVKDEAQAKEELRQTDQFGVFLASGPLPTEESPGVLVVCLGDSAWSLQVPGAAPAAFPYDDTSLPILTDIQRSLIPAPIVDILEVPRVGCAKLLLVLCGGCRSLPLPDPRAGRQAELLCARPRAHRDPRLPRARAGRPAVGEQQRRANHLARLAATLGPGAANRARARVCGCVCVCVCVCMCACVCVCVCVSV
jgi:hypothetical protein